jgi:hypothetical protein
MASRAYFTSMALKIKGFIWIAVFTSGDSRECNYSKLYPLWAEIAANSGEIGRKYHFDPKKGLRRFVFGTTYNLSRSRIWSGASEGEYIKSFFGGAASSGSNKDECMQMAGHRRAADSGFGPGRKRDYAGEPVQYVHRPVDAGRGRQFLQGIDG